jgi:hypothetical protein
VEILSPSNTAKEMAEKRALYFEASAREVWIKVWICELDGRLSFHCGGDLCEDSELCSRFPKQV